MPAIEYREHDFGVPYKRFVDLEVGDILYFINLEDLSTERKKVMAIDVKNTSDNFSHNRQMVEYAVDSEVSKELAFKLYDGNTFIDDFSLSRYNIIICTDERISKSITCALHSRNHIQWEKFTSIFGNPMDGYAKKEVVLR